MKKELLERFEKICDELSKDGINVVAVLSEYDSQSVHFDTYIKVVNQDIAPFDHVILDSLHVITNEWSDIVHQ